MKLTPLIKLFNNKSYIFFVLLGFLWIILHFILRFIIERFPHKITPDIPKISIFIAIILLFMHLIIIYLNLSIIIAFKRKENSLTSFIKNLVDFMYWKPLKEFHNKVIVNIPLSGYILDDLGNTYINTCKTKPRIFLSILLFNFLPRLIVAFAFFTDVVIYQQFAYVYILLILIIFPLLFDSLIYILDNFASRATQEIEKKVIVLYVPEDEEVLFVWRANNVLVEGKDLEFYTKYWFMFNDFTVFFDYIKTIKAKYLPYIIVVASSCYFVGWIYYLTLVLTMQDIYIGLYSVLYVYTYIEEPFSGFFI